MRLKRFISEASDTVRTAVRNSYLGLYLPRNKKSCDECMHYTKTWEHYKFTNGEYAKILGGSCSLYGKFQDCRISNVNQVYIDEEEKYEQMLKGQAEHCGDFKEKLIK
jgi:hypothetical protein